MSETVVQEQPVNIAELMAKQGIKTEDSTSFEVPNIETTQQQGSAEEPKQEAPATTETVVAAPGPEAGPAVQPVEPVKTEPVVTPAAMVQQPVQPAEVDWKEVLKKQPEVDVLKAIGLDEKMINFLNRWKGGEDLKDYLEAATVDYSKMNPEELLRRQLQREYSGLAADDFEEIYKMLVVEKYKLDPDVFNETEIRRGKLMLGVEAEKVRQDFVKRQQELMFSKPPEAGPSQADIEAQAQLEQREKDMQTYKGLVENDTHTKDFLTSRFLKIGEGEKAFNLEITKPNEVLDLLYDPGKWAQKLWNEDGTPNIRKQLLLGAIAYDDTAFFNNWAKHYEMLGAKSVAEKIQNASQPSPGAPATSNPDNSNPISQLARFGTITSGD